MLQIECMRCATEMSCVAITTAVSVFEFVPNSVEIESDSSGYSLIDYTRSCH